MVLTQLVYEQQINKTSIPWSHDKILYLAGSGGAQSKKVGWGMGGTDVIFEGAKRMKIAFSAERINLFLGQNNFWAPFAHWERRHCICDGRLGDGHAGNDVDFHRDLRRDLTILLGVLAYSFAIFLVLARVGVRQEIEFAYIGVLHELLSPQKMLVENILENPYFFQSILEYTGKFSDFHPKTIK